MRFRLLAAGLTAGLVTLAAPAAEAFCGFYVGKADTSLFNEASQVVMVRDGERTVLTMSNDYKGELTDFALVVPVPVVLKREQLHVGERKYLERLDAYSAPRLVEYFDPNPCAPPMRYRAEKVPMAAAPSGAAMDKERSKSLGVTVEAQYTVGEYDILILSAKESEGLETWLRESGYKIPPKASKALSPYIKQDMKFFVAKVNLKEQKATGFKYLRPLQMAYESKKFMLPIRLGMANAAGGPQDLVIYAMTRQGRVESSNYRTVKVPSDMDIPVYVKSEFNKFYPALFEKAYEREEKKAIFTEYVWDMGWCDPCAADPLNPEELRNLGVFWLDEQNPNGMGGGSQVVLTRMHTRYDGEHFPEDLVFQVTNDRQNFQARYVLRHAYKGDLQCEAGKQYLKELDKRHQQEAETLANLTGWELGTITQKMGDDAPGKKTGKDSDAWYKKLWK